MSLPLITQTLVSLLWLTSLTSPTVLARVEINAPIAHYTLPVYAHLMDSESNEYILVLAPRSDLEAIHMPYQILDAPASPSTTYVLALERQPGARARASDVIHTLHDDGRQLIARATFTEAQTLIDLGFDVHRLGTTPLNISRLPNIPRLRAVRPDYQPTIAAMLSQVRTDTLYTYTGQLSGEWPTIIVGHPYTIATRHTSSGAPIEKATQYVHEHFEILGLVTQYHEWSTEHYEGRNIIGELTGTTYANEIILITAHLDDMPPGEVAPGADDNASGVVGVLVTADILSQHKFERTVRFVCFTGEEQGLHGSTAYAQHVAAAEEDIVAVYNMDMIAWDSVDAPTLRLHTRTPYNPGYTSDLSIAQVFSDVVRLYGLTDNLVPLIEPDGLIYSDHASFWPHGYPAILAIEDDLEDFNPYYHTPADRLERLNLTYYTNYVKATVGTAAHLASLEGATTPPHLTLATVVSSKQPEAGGRLTYTVHVSNSGGLATGVHLTATLPNHTQLAASNPPAQHKSNTLQWNDLLIRANTTLDVHYVITVSCIPTGTQLTGGQTYITASEWPTTTISPPVTVTVQRSPAIAAFTFPTPVLRNQATQFTNLSQNSVSHVWDFGDGRKATTHQPTHTYTSRDTYTVTLLAIGPCEQTDTTNHPLTVEEYAMALEQVPSREAPPGQSVDHTLGITNTGTLTDHVHLTITPLMSSLILTTSSLTSTWPATLTPTHLTLTPNAASTITITVAIPSYARDGDGNLTTVIAKGISNTAHTHVITWAMLYHTFLPLILKLP